VAPAAHQTDGSATLKRNFASLEGHGTPLADFHPAQGLDASSSKVPPRLRVERPLEWDPSSLEDRSPPSGKALPRSGAGHPLERGSASLEGLMGSAPPYLLPRQRHLMH
jgi:hypothetical protein